MAAVITLLLLPGCKKLVEPTPPPDLIIGEDVFVADSNAIAVMNSVYSLTSQQNSFAHGSFSIGHLTGFAADELIPTASNT